MMTVGRASDILISDVQQMLTQLQLAVGLSTSNYVVFFG